MSVSLPENCLYLPSPNNAYAGELIELRPALGFTKNGFVLIAYQNPQVKAVVPRYYQIINRYAISVKQPKKEQTPILIKAALTRTEYKLRVMELKKHIHLGNIYEINFCQNFFADEVTIDPLPLFCKLQSIAKAPYAALLKLNEEYILSASPELYLKKTGSLISTKPIKGTIRRGATAKEDQELKNSLFHSLKERTENVMAVDVARNDLSHFAKRGTVQVNKLYNIESFETVHQMVSTVSCELKEGVSFEELIRDSFPMASMTGAPKLRAMTLIDEFENFERCYYSGAMGLVNGKGDFTLSVLIRSIFYNAETKHLNFGVGGAITYLSDPEKEYEECLLKAGALLKALEAEVSL